jgi:uncharacterized protein (TIGR02594 family)
VVLQSHWLPGLLKACRGGLEVRAPVQLTAFDLAKRFIGLHETPGMIDNPAILAMLRLDASWPGHDEVAWCSAFVNYVAWLLDIPRSRSLAARSWLIVGEPVQLADASPDFDVVILKRGDGHQPGPEELSAQGHVGFFAGVDGDQVLVLGGNQNDRVSIGAFPKSRILGIRRL